MASFRNVHKRRSRQTGAKRIVGRVSAQEILLADLTDTTEDYLAARPLTTQEIELALAQAKRQAERQIEPATQSAQSVKSSRQRINYLSLIISRLYRQFRILWAMARFERPGAWLRVSRQPSWP